MISILRNRKGYFFSLTVIILLLLSALYFSVMTSPGHSREAAVASQRINEVDRFIRAMERDASTGVNVASFRAILAMHNYTRDNGYFSQDGFDDVVSGLILEGYLYGVMPSVMEESHMVEWMDRYVQTASMLGLELEFSDYDAGLYQEEPWIVKAFFSANITVTDDFTSSTWNKRMHAVSSHNITKFFDPLYTVETDNRFEQRIRVSPDPEGLHLGFYVANNDAPGFLERFTGLQEGFGIESLVDVPELASVGVVRSGRPTNDWLFFSNTPFVECQVQGEPSWFIIDSDTQGLYGVTCAP